jgi:hypothetical protein
LIFRIERIKFYYNLCIQVMKIRHILSWLLFLGSCFCFAQNDSLPNVTPESLLKDGVYLTYNDLKTNNPLPKENIVSSEDKTQSDFISKTLNNNKEIMFTYKGSQYRAEVSKIWGYCQNGNVYVHFKEDKFWRITVFGNISHFIATIMVIRTVSNGGYGMGGMGMGYGGMGGMGYGGGGYTQVKQSETHEFLMDYNSGDIVECTPTDLETFLSRDMRLYDQYMQIKKRKRKDFMILYIRKYNAEHPITVPTSTTGK